MLPWRLSLAALAALAFAACHDAPSPAILFDDASNGVPSIEQCGPPRVQLSWRLFGTQRWLEANGAKRESAVVELLINGGAPPRIELGRRDTEGCKVHVGSTSVDSEREGILASVDCRAARVVVSRPVAEELRVVASDVPALTRVETATVRVSAAADIAIETALPRVPDETLGL